MSEVRRLENEDEEKFWEAWIKDDLIFVYRYGKIGANGHTKLKKFKTRAEAEAELELRLNEKIGEGFEEPDAEDEDEDESGDEPDDDADDESAPGDEPDDDADDESAPDDEPDGDLRDELAPGDGPDDDLDDESGPGDAPDGDPDDEHQDEDEDEDEDEGRPKKRAPSRAARARQPKAPPPPPPEPPRLPARFARGHAAPETIEAARVALVALAAAAGGRSHRVTRRGRAARRAFERLGGLDPAATPALAGPFEDVMKLVLAPKRRLPLHVALGLLWEIDAAASARVAKGLRAKMLGSPASDAIGVLAATFDAVGDPEVAVHTGALLLDRATPAAAWSRKYARVRPFLVDALGAKGTHLGAFFGGLRAPSDPILGARVALAARDAGPRAGEAP